MCALPYHFFSFKFCSMYSWMAWKVKNDLNLGLDHTAYYECHSMTYAYTHKRKTSWVDLGVLSRLQTIDKVGQLFGRGLVSEDSRLMKSLNHDTCHLSRHDCDVKKWQTIRMPTLLCCFIFWLRNSIKSGSYGSAVGHSTGKQFAGRTFHLPIVFGN